MKLKKMFKKIIQKVFSRKLFQPFFEEVLNLCFKILNIGEGQSVETSGEINVFKLLQKYSSKEIVIVFDVGAHDGEWFKLFHKEYGLKKKCYSFEPSQTSYLELNKIKVDLFYPQKIALGNKKEVVFLYSKNNGDSGAQITTTENKGEAVNITTLDIFCKENFIDEIDLLKLDTEGYELKILGGAENMILKNKIKIIQFEFGAPSEENYSFFDFFNVLGEKYYIYRILQNGIFRIKEYKHYYEIKTVTNFVAIRKDLI